MYLVIILTFNESRFLLMTVSSIYIVMQFNCPD